MLVGGFNLSEKSSQNRDENKKSLKPPPSLPQAGDFDMYFLGPTVLALFSQCPLQEGSFWDPESEMTSLYIPPRKTNMEAENEPLEEEIPIKNHHFQVPC